ncbi:MAG: hypothetical protein ACK47B_06700 [Armatimonadota bacterium]
MTRTLPSVPCRTPDDPCSGSKAAAAITAALRAPSPDGSERSDP